MKIDRLRLGTVETELQDGRRFTLRPGMSYHVADGADAHRSSTRSGLVDRWRRILRCMSSLRRGSLAFGAAMALAACGSIPTREQPLKHIVPLTASVPAPGVSANSDKLFVVVTFSGGGKRAAAFSFGVLEALRDVAVTTPDGEQHSLLDEIDL